MAKTAKYNATRVAEKAAPVPDHANDDWFCKNCGQVNSPEALECARCTFARNYDPEATAQVDFTSVQATLEQEELKRRHRITFYLELVKNLLLLVLVAVFLIIGIRLMRDWPFEGPYARDARDLSVRVLEVRTNVDMGVTKARYDELVAEMRAEADRFKILYGESGYRQRVSFQKLYQAAEYYILADDAWQKQLTADSSMPANPASRSINANDQVKQLWDNASANASTALEDLR
jgi:hypothetical protein